MNTKVKLMAALVLCDVTAHGLKAGQLLQGSPSLVDALAKAGEVDPRKDAVAAAKERGAETVRSRIEVEAEQELAAREQQRAALADLEAKFAAATDDAQKLELAGEISKLKGALA